MFHRKNLLYIISRIFHIKFRITRSLELYLNIFVKYNEKNHKRNFDHEKKTLTMMNRSQVNSNVITLSSLPSDIQ